MYCIFTFTYGKGFKPASLVCSNYPYIRRMLRIGALFTAFALLLPVILLFGMMHLEQRQLSRHIKRELLGGKQLPGMLWLRFSREQQKTLRWEHATEFEHNHTMYDVADSLVTPDSAFYFCYPDHRETRLKYQISALAQHLMADNPQKSEGQTHLLRFIRHLIHNQIPIHQLTALYMYRYTRMPDTAYSKTSTGFFTPASPPPDLL
jgi:hypothetical protein